MAEAEHADGTAWMTTDPPAGRSLADILRTDGRIDLASACTIGVAVLSALAAAHAEGIVHGDVTPSNIMVADDGHVRLIGFGTGHRMDDARAGVAGMPVSSVPYLAPERFDGVTTPACDLFAPGVTLYQALEGGQSPFQRDSVESTIEAVRTFAPPAYDPDAGAQASTSVAPAAWFFYAILVALFVLYLSRDVVVSRRAGLQWPRRTPPRSVVPGYVVPGLPGLEVFWRWVVPVTLLAALAVLSELPFAEARQTYSYARSGGQNGEEVRSMFDMMSPWSNYTYHPSSIFLLIVLGGAGATAAAIVLRRPGSPKSERLLGYLGAPIAILGFARLIWHFGAGVHSPMLFTVHYSDKWGEETSSLAPAAWLFYTILVALFVLYASRDIVVSRRAGVRSPLPPPAYTPAPPR